MVALDAQRLASALTALRPHAPPIKAHSLTPDGRSWLLHGPSWWPAAPDELRDLWNAQPTEPTMGQIFGRTVEFPRRSRSYGYDYTYTGQTQRADPLGALPSLASSVLRELSSCVPELGGHNAALLNWYDASLGHYMGAHREDEKELVRIAPIVSLSWSTPGHFRRFRMLPRHKDGGAAELSECLPALGGDEKGVAHLRNGCLLVMGGCAQHTHKHELMKPRKTKLGEGDGRRINLTLRAFAAGTAALDVATSSAGAKRRRDGGGAGDPPPEADDFRVDQVVDSMREAQES